MFVKFHHPLSILWRGLGGEARLCSLHLFYLFPYFSFNFIGKLRIIEHYLFYCITTLSEFITVIAEPASAFLNNSQFNTHIDYFTCLGDAFSKNDIEFSATERRGHFIFYNFHFYTVAYRFISIFYL